MKKENYELFLADLSGALTNENLRSDVFQKTITKMEKLLFEYENLK